MSGLGLGQRQLRLTGLVAVESGVSSRDVMDLT